MAEYVKIAGMSENPPGSGRTAEINGRSIGAAN
jgi:hypothetical protein